MLLRRIRDLWIEFCATYPLVLTIDPRGAELILPHKNKFAFYHLPTLSWHNRLKSFPAEDKNPIILHIQECGCC